MPETSSPATGALIGTWRLLRWEAHDPDGRVLHPFGPDAEGIMIYTAGGTVATQLMRARRPTFGAHDLLRGNDREMAAAFGGYIAYFGTYTVDPDHDLVIHHVQGSLFPNWVGEQHTRLVALTQGGTHLTLRSTPILMGGQELINILVYERVG